MTSPEVERAMWCAYAQTRLFEQARRKYESAWRKMRRPEKHSVLTVDMLRAHIEHEATECVTAVREACLDLLDEAKFHKDIDAIVKRHAQAFRPLQQIDEALTHEARRAYLANLDPRFSPFLDKAYVPLNETASRWDLSPGGPSSGTRFVR